MNQTISKSDYLNSLPRISDVKKCTPDVLINSFRNLDVTVEEQDIPIDQFTEYLNKINYPETFPNYYKEFGPERQAPHVFNTKCLEHFLSFDLCNIFVKPNIKIMDIAASNSPATSILRILGYKDVWKQDIQYLTDHKNFIIGGNANRIDCEDEMFDALTLHNSWEHFEGNSARDFLKEAQRILKPGGKLCIIPLFINNIPFSLTSPDCWEHKYKNVTGHPEFDSRIPILIDNKPQQRLIRVPSPEIIVEDLKSISNVSTKVYFFKNAGNFKFDPFALVCSKL